MGPDGSLQHDSLCFSSDDNNHYTSFLYQVQTMLVYYLKANHLHLKKTNLLLWQLWKTVQKLQKLMDLCSHKHDFSISAEWMFFATNYCKSPCDGIGGAVKTTCSQAKPPKVFE